MRPRCVFEQALYEVFLNLPLSLHRWIFVAEMKRSLHMSKYDLITRVCSLSQTVMSPFEIDLETSLLEQENYMNLPSSSDQLKTLRRRTTSRAKMDINQDIQPTTTTNPPTTSDTSQDEPEKPIPILIGTSRLHHTIADLPISTLMRSSSRTNIPRAFYLHPQTSHTATTEILSWITAQAPLETISPVPCPLSITFEEACHRYNICYQLYIRRELRDEELRDEIWLYIWSQRFWTTNEFEMVLDLLSFDKALMSLAVSKVVYWLERLREDWDGDDEWEELLRRADALLTRRDHGRERVVS